MELNEDIFNQIHQYLNEDLAEDERQKFEIQMNQNPVLAQEVATQRRIKSGLKVNNYKQQFSNIHSQLKQGNALPVFEEQSVIKVNSSKSNLRYFAYAASIILMLGVGLFFYLKPVTTEPLAKIKTSKPLIKTQQPDEVEIADVKKPINKPESVDYDKILADNFVPKPVIENPFSSEKLGVSPSKIATWEADTLNLRKGIHYLETKKTQNAIEAFQKLKLSKFENIKFHAEWYLALTYLQEKDIIKAQKQLKIIAASESHIYSKKSKALLKSLK
jgi:hypothetical protein